MYIWCSLFVALFLQLFAYRRTHEFVSFLLSAVKKFTHCIYTALYHSATFSSSSVWEREREKEFLCIFSALRNLLDNILDSHLHFLTYIEFHRFKISSAQCTRVCVCVNINVKVKKGEKKNSLTEIYWQWQRQCQTIANIIICHK